jgi:hypothetical protein
MEERGGGRKRGGVPGEGDGSFVEVEAHSALELLLDQGEAEPVHGF